MKKIVIGVVGNPNCGKTTLFNSLTGTKQQVGNWPGVTVDRKMGSYRFKDSKVEVVDTPGVYSLAAASLDEKITRTFVLSGEADLIVNIVDASNIERNLYLTSQLLEMRVPLIIALNMMDMATERQMEINIQGLADRLGCPVIPLTASKNKGVDALRETIFSAVGRLHLPVVEIIYPAVVQAARNRVAEGLKEICVPRKIDPHWLALKMLEGDESLGDEMVGQTTQTGIGALRKEIEQQEDEEVDIVIASARYNFISCLTRDFVRNRGQVSTTLSDRIDGVVLSRIFGIPIFLLAMYLMFMFTINLGGAFIDFFKLFAGTIFVDGFTAMLTALHAPEWMVVVLAGGIGGGIRTMATFIPPIGFMFLFLAVLEDSGYMARAAFVMDRFMRFIGLPGKAFVPLLVGFGCNVPAIMASRTLENERDRTLTIMMTPFMSCGARLPVYALFAAAFFPVGGQNLVFLLYLLGIGFAVLTGMILKNTLLKGDITPFVMEMPPYHLPTIQSVLLRAYDRLRAFLFKAGKVLVPIIMVLSFLNSLGTDGSFGNENTEKSALASVSKVLTPVLKPLGVTAENWPATVGVFTGIFAKEAVVGTLDALYAGIDQQAAAGEQAAKEPFDFWAGIAGAFATIPEKLLGVADNFVDPLKLSVGDISNAATAAQAQKVRVSTFGSMVTLFGSQSAAFAYMLFVLLYFPCGAATAAVYRETNLSWTVFIGLWTTFLAYLVSTLFYQVANFSAHSGYSLLVIATDFCAFIGVVVVMKLISKSRLKTHAISVAERIPSGLAEER